MLDGGWNTTEVAAAQYELTQEELAGAFKGRAFVYFQSAMGHVHWQPWWEIWDIGAGTGHYGTYIRERISADMKYKALDASQAMVQVARQKRGLEAYQIDVMDLLTKDIRIGWKGTPAGHMPDLVLHSQCIELLDKPVLALQALLERFSCWIILHKLRWGKGFVEEPTYYGYRGRVYEWRYHEVLEVIDREHRSIVAQVHWGMDPIETWVIKAVDA